MKIYVNHTASEPYTSLGQTWIRLVIQQYYRHY